MVSTDKLAVSTDKLDLNTVLELFGRFKVAKTNNSKSSYIDQLYNLVASDEHVLEIIRTILSTEDKKTRELILKELHGYTDLSHILLKLIRLLIPIERFKSSIVDVIINYKPNNEYNGDKFFFNELNNDSEINLDLMYTRLLNSLITNFSRQTLVSKIERRFITSLASHIIPKVNQPLLIFEKYLSDRLLSDESTIAVITLKPIFYLMVNHGLVQPNYYTRFKDLLPTVFESKQWQSLLNTLKLSLMSTCLPIETRTEFGKDLATICLAAASLLLTGAIHTLPKSSIHS
ncbi:hypothetical protein GJ496_007711 [Pomphorhynchus laevis]|nr:hypothetical protein GJ496_007711 [Pomphorhynchus laevis]